MSSKSFSPLFKAEKKKRTCKSCSPKDKLNNKVSEHKNDILLSVSSNISRITQDNSLERLLDEDLQEETLENKEEERRLAYEIESIITELKELSSSITKKNNKLKTPNINEISLFPNEVYTQNTDNIHQAIEKKKREVQTNFIFKEGDSLSFSNYSKQENSFFNDKLSENKHIAIELVPMAEVNLLTSTIAATHTNMRDSIENIASREQEMGNYVEKIILSPIPPLAQEPPRQTINNHVNKNISSSPKKSVGSKAIEMSQPLNESYNIKLNSTTKRSKVLRKHTGENDSSIPKSKIDLKSSTSLEEKKAIINNEGCMLRTKFAMEKHKKMKLEQKQVMEVQKTEKELIKERLKKMAMEQKVKLKSPKNGSKKEANKGKDFLANKKKVNESTVNVSDSLHCGSHQVDEVDDYQNILENNKEQQEIKNGNECFFGKKNIPGTSIEANLNTVEDLSCERKVDEEQQNPEMINSHILRINSVNSFIGDINTDELNDLELCSDSDNLEGSNFREQTDEILKERTSDSNTKNKEMSHNEILDNSEIECNQNENLIQEDLSKIDEEKSNKLRTDIEGCKNSKDIQLKGNINNPNAPEVNDIQAQSDSIWKSTLSDTILKEKNKHDAKNEEENTAIEDVIFQIWIERDSFEKKLLKEQLEDTTEKELEIIEKSNLSISNVSSSQNNYPREEQIQISTINQEDNIVVINDSPFVETENKSQASLNSLESIPSEATKQQNNNETEEKERIHSYFSLLQAGSMMQKYTKQGRGKSHSKFVWVNVKTRSLHWGKSQKKLQKAKHAIIVGVELGLINTRKKREELVKRSLSVTVQKKKRLESLHLTCDSEEVATKWITAIRCMLQESLENKAV